MTEKDFKALAKGRQLLEGLQYRSSFGRSVTPCNGKWDDTDKAVVGYYEGATTIDTTNPVETEQYLIESSYFLNNLNEHLHLEGYHFDMTGVTNGAIYFAKDRDYKGNGFASSEDEATYTQESAYRIYLMNKDKCNKQIRHMIDEALILTDDQLSITEQVDRLYILQEGIGDKLSDAWDKFVDFIRKIFNKFMEFVNRTISSDKNYLEKYKEIILHRKFKADPVDIDGNYDVGIHRISTYQLAFPDISVMEKWPTDNEDTGRKTAATEIFPEYRGKTGVDFNEFIKSWFKGGEDGKTFQINESSINLSNMYNFCYNFQKISKNLNKNQTLLTNAVNNVRNHAKETFAAARGTLSPDATKPGEQPQSKQTDTAIAQNNTVTVDGTKYTIDPTKKTSVESALAEYNKAKTPDNLTKLKQACENSKGPNNTDTADKPNNTVTVKSASVVGTSVVLAYSDNSSDTFQLKDGVDKSLATKSIQNAEGQSKDAAKRTISTYVKEAAYNQYSLYKTIQEAVTKSGTTSGGSGSSPGNFGNATNGAGSMRERENYGTKVNTDAQNVTELDEKEKKFNTQAGYFRAIGQEIFAAMLTAAETIKKDYMKIITMHVKSYMGEKESERGENKQSAQAMTDYGSQLSVAFTDEKVSKAGIANSMGELVTKLDTYRKTLADSNTSDEDKKKYNTELYELLHKISMLNQGPNGGPNKIYNRAEDAIADLERAQQAQKPA